MAYIKTFKPFPNSLVESGLESRVGNTPLLPLRRVAEHLPDGVQLFAKAEWFNPSGSVKDRPALNIIQRGGAGRELGTGKLSLVSTDWHIRLADPTFGAALRIPDTLATLANAN